MTNTNLLKLIAVISYVFTCAKWSYETAPLPVLVLAMLWWLVIGMVMTSQIVRDHKWGLLSLFGFAPLYWYHSPTFAISLLAALLGVFYFKKVLIRTNYLELRSNFKSALALLICLMILKLLMPYVNEVTSFNELAQLTLIFLMASVVVIRVARSEVAGIASKTIYIRNIRGTMAILAFIGLSLTDQAYQLVQLFSELISSIIPQRILILIHARTTQWLDRLIKSLFSENAYWVIVKRLVVRTKKKQIPNDPKSLLEQKELLQNKLEAVQEISHWMLGALVVIIMLIVLYYIIKRNNELKDRTDFDVVVTEVREPLKWFSTNKRGFRMLGRIPYDLNLQVRFYYQQFLKILKKANIEIAPNDTTLDILEKTQQKFVPGHCTPDLEGVPSDTGPSEVRGIYIASRYGNQVATQKDVNRLKKIIQAIKLP